MVCFVQIFIVLIYNVAAFEYLLSNVKTDFKESEFEEACGAGVVISPEQIEECIEKVIVKFKDELLKAR